jgi:CubicO group peptidase (beta-lactamase class C family)
MKTLRRLTGAALAVFVMLAAGPCLAADPASLGLSAERLARIDATVGQYVAEKRIAGAVTFVSRGGRIAQFRAFGMRDAESGDPMRTDTIFRIASMTKAVTGVATMILMEDAISCPPTPSASTFPRSRRPP